MKHNRKRKHADYGAAFVSIVALVNIVFWTVAGSYFIAQLLKTAIR